ncbi:MULTISPECIES: putative hydro-lyase [unclassified Achromobacter]|uniref:putative hydro-lyase n=1 Tax=unclassified Achromobacter TaxID=2626865 RepID=UPI000B51E1CD|nr:hypothetical protein CEY05_28585 [Achromobacter sp. HZ34]OWT70593.1 hypothetical protein CEY04_27415 [Achromobacter sp. HZ28]
MKGSTVSTAANTGYEARQLIRSRQHTTQTSNLAPGYVQANLAILPSAQATDFLRFCSLNPKPCPLLGSSDAGDWRLPQLGKDIDIRTDLPKYRIWRNGALEREVPDIKDYWRDDLVAFLLGCSFSFEDELLRAGLTLHHHERGCDVPVYRTSIPTIPAGPFAGPLVVSMRSFKPAEAIRAIQITSRMPAVHGAPVHIGLPESIGIADIDKPDYGTAVPMEAGELPVFWACGVTPQAVVEAAGLDFCITHAPAHMLVTDLRNSDFAVL